VRCLKNEDILASELVASPRDVMQRGSEPSQLVEERPTPLGRELVLDGWWRYALSVSTVLYVDDGEG